MTEIALAAFVLGLTGGLKPGPLSVYVIHVTLSSGKKAGFIASLAPFVSDGPIILLVLLVFSGGRQFEYFIAGLSFAGSLYLVYIAVNILISKQQLEMNQSEAPATFMTAVRLNLINPYPYIFWTTVGGAYLLRGDVIDGITFVFVMLGTLGITKFIVATSIQTLGNRFDSRVYLLLLRILALLLIGFAIRLAVDGYTLLHEN